MEGTLSAATTRTAPSLARLLILGPCAHECNA
jgi:hypothetical protein